MIEPKRMMFCPLSPIDPQTGRHYTCEPDNCTWFDREVGKCAVPSTSQSLDWMKGRMDDMMISGLPIKS